MERVGEVVGVSGNQLQVVFCRPADCAKCGACHGGRAQMELKLTGKAQKGDQVVVEMPTGNVLKASVLAYTVPLIGLVGGMMLGNALKFTADSNLNAIIGGAAGLLTAFLIIRLSDRFIKQNPKWQPQLVRVISACEEEK